MVVGGAEGRVRWVGVCVGVCVGGDMLLCFGDIFEIVEGEGEVKDDIV